MKQQKSTKPITLKDDKKYADGWMGGTDAAND